MERGLLLAFADGPKDHGHIATILLGAGLNNANFSDVIGQTLQEAETQLRTRLLTATEHNGHLDLGSLLEEANYVTLLGLIIVIIDLRAELLFLNHGLLLVLTGFASLLSLLVLELAVVHDLAHGRLGIRCYLNQVKVSFVRKLACIIGTDNANLLTGRTDETNFRNADAFVDSSFSADENS